MNQTSQTVYHDAPEGNAGGESARIHAGKIDLLYGQLEFSLLGTLAGGLMLYVGLRLAGSSQDLLWWPVLLFFVSWCRYLSLLAYRRCQDKASQARKFDVFFCLGAGASGAVWGGALFMIEPGSATQMAVVAMFLVSIMAGTGTLYAASVSAFVSFNVPTVIVTSAYLLLVEQILLLVVTLIIYAVTITLACKRIHRVIENALYLRFQNADLIDDLHEERQRVNAMNVDLEERVHERTSELRSVNDALVEQVNRRERVELDLAASESRYRALYHDNPSLFITCDARGNVVSINDFGAQALGYSAADAVPETLFKMVHKDERHELAIRLEECIGAAGEPMRWQSTLYQASGAPVTAGVTARAITDSESGTNIYLVCEDMTATADLEKRLHFQATHDALTNLYNRRELENRLERAVVAAQHGKSTHVLCYLDLDRFKIVNDTCGHIAGDALLRQLGRVLLEVTRDRDTLARLGGDEFALLLEHTSIEDSRRKIEALRRRIDEFEFVWDQQRFKISASFGVCEVNTDSGTVTDILRDADTACYLAKDGGRNTIHYHVAGTEAVQERRGEMGWVSRLEAAMVEQRLCIALQPIVPAHEDSGENGHFEALLRLRDEDGEIIAPGFFLPAAERYGLLPRIDRWVVNEIIQLLDAPDCDAGITQIAVNLSGSSLASKSFFEEIETRLANSPSVCKRICFEITETTAIANLSEVCEFIERLQGLGCRFSLDDFGTGMASFEYLRSMPVDYLKIDGSFVRDIVRDPVSLTMVKAINEVGHAMGKRTVAEFVESEQIRESLCELGIDYLQGFAIGRPTLIPQHAEGVRSPLTSSRTGSE